MEKAGHPAFSAVRYFVPSTRIVVPVRLLRSAGRRHLTDDEGQLLIENTERLIQQFEAEYQAEVAHQAELADAQAAQSRQPSPVPLSSHRQPQLRAPPSARGDAYFG